MAGQASNALGAPEIAGTLVNPKGMAKKMTASTAGMVAAGAAGSFAAKRLTGLPYDGAPDVPYFGRVGYVAVTVDEVALVKTKTGLMKMKVSDEVLARAPRAEVTSAELDKGRLLSHLKIVFANGVNWEFDVPTKEKRSAERVVEALGGTISG
jgi:hypothetical protein